jgi:hypothetical protein
MSVERTLVRPRSSGSWSPSRRLSSSRRPERPPAALKSGDQAALQTALDARYANAHEIAVFLNSANPANWPLDEMDQRMKDHLDATTREAVARQQGDWDADVAAYDDVHAQALEMADMLSSGIVAQFRDRFRP